MKKLSCVLAIAAMVLTGLPVAASHDRGQLLRATNASATYVEVGVDTHGDATVAWIEGGTLMSATKTRRKFLRPQTIATNVVEASLDVASNGNAVLAFRRSTPGGGSLVAASTRTGAQVAFTRSHTLAQFNERDFVGQLEARTSARGRAVVTWSRASNNRFSDVYAVSSDADGVFREEPVTLGGLEYRAFPQIGLDQAGRTLAVWDASTRPPSPAQGEHALFAAAAGADQGFESLGRIHTLQAEGSLVPDVAVNSRGDAVVAYTDVAGNSGVSHVEVLYGDVTGSFRSPQVLTLSTSGRVPAVEVAIDDGGRAAVIASAPMGSSGGLGLQAAVSDAAGNFTGSMQVLDDFIGANPATNVYGIDADAGQFTAAWVDLPPGAGGPRSLRVATAIGGVFGQAHELGLSTPRDSLAVMDVAGSFGGHFAYGWLVGAPGFTTRALAGPVAPGPDPIFGTRGADRLRGTSAGEPFYAGRGNDRLEGLRGDDVLFGGRGDDDVLGHRGDDRLMGGPGDDFLYGARGNDVFAGGAGEDVCMISPHNARFERRRMTGCEFITIPPARPRL
ncbi:MAG TPA: calcium-binding protein [Actinomycetota bacterium]|nr:calcium-binding protein [Actinomycetota bacterium]